MLSHNYISFINNYFLEQLQPWLNTMNMLVIFSRWNTGGYVVDIFHQYTFVWYSYQHTDKCVCFLYWCYFNVVFSPSQLLVQVNISGSSCREPEFLIFLQILNGEEFVQCFHVEQRNHITSEGEGTIHECNFNCGNYCGSEEVSLFVRLQLKSWRHDLTRSPTQICGVSIQE